MNDPNSSSNPPPGRATLKLKAGARKAPVESKTPAVVRPPGKPVNPNARWSDEYKQQMQADMDALVARRR
jgi:hypothetical protein